MPDDAFEIVRSLATARRAAFGEVEAGLIRQALDSAVPINSEKPFPCFEIPGDAKPVTLDETLKAEYEA